MESVYIVLGVVVGALVAWAVFMHKSIAQSKDHMKSEFENMANRIFEDKSAKLSDASQKNLENVLNPLREQLGEFKKKVEDVYDKETRDRASLLEQVKHLQELNQKISTEAHNLTDALKGDSKAQGDWGEMILERVLEESGLHKDREYEVQHSARDSEGSLKRPDVIIHLPDNKDVIIDSKVSLTDYERYCSADSDEQRNVAQKAHINSLKSHIKELSEKNYEELETISTLDFVLMFVPIESALYMAMDADKELYNIAWQKNIIMVSPSNLLATLKVIATMWRTEHQSRHALDIADKAGALYDKFADFANDLEGIGKHLDRAKESYEKSHNKLKSGKGNLIKRSQDLLDMGVKARKKLPSALDDGSE